ncbi:transposase [Streptomyces sp. NPDC056480]|uniref:transposase n=1 Tax=Streptomyces sp. NPDC056480 TaxID=3345833 RepID=UPI0036787100
MPTILALQREQRDLVCDPPPPQEWPSTGTHSPPGKRSLAVMSKTRASQKQLRTVIDISMNALSCALHARSQPRRFAWVRRLLGPRGRRAGVPAEQWMPLEAGSAHQESDGTDGVPRTTTELRDKGERVGHKRVARVMRNLDLAGARLTQTVSPLIWR